MKKLLALILAGTLTLSMSMFALASGSSSCGTPCNPCEDPVDPAIAYWVDQGLSREEILIAQEGEANALAQEATGIPWETAIAAGSENKSVGEYMNNAATAAPGLSTVTPVAQGGGVIINGQPSNQVFSVNKPLSAHVESAKAQAAAVGGRVMNCVDVDGSVFFTTATVNFYMPGVVSGQNIQVYHLANGTWTPVAIAEIREDHVVVDMTAYGILAFVEVPAETAAE
ncbi:MAG: hypothetical protein NC314_08270 [Roseburia sp.]|nr:hypothetical protein [Roseburia sp.]MCM1242820.1 hypothetical protein [Roseburia sp.]